MLNYTRNGCLLNEPPNRTGYDFEVDDEDLVLEWVSTDGNIRHVWTSASNGYAM